MSTEAREQSNEVPTMIAPEARCENCGHERYFHLEYGCVEHLRERCEGETWADVACKCGEFHAHQPSKPKTEMSQESQIEALKSIGTTWAKRPIDLEPELAAYEKRLKDNNSANPVWAAGYRAARMEIGERLLTQGGYLECGAIAAWLTESDDRAFAFYLSGTEPIDSRTKAQLKWLRERMAPLA